MMTDELVPVELVMFVPSFWPNSRLSLLTCTLSPPQLDVGEVHGRPAILQNSWSG